MRKQSGFTLIEIAIVLVIIGLLLGGILKGQEMIENAKVKNAVSDLNGAVAAFNAYRDRYRTIPGDDGPLATLQARGTAWAAPLTAGDADGILEVTAAQTFTGAGEGQEFFMHLRAAGFLSGDPSAVGAAAMPRNPFNGLTGVTSDATVLGNMAGNKVCMSQVPGKAAIALDGQLDDGQPDTGTLRATLGVAGANTQPGAAAAAYSEDNIYTICRTI